MQKDLLVPNVDVEAAGPQAKTTVSPDTLYLRDLDMARIPMCGRCAANPGMCQKLQRILAGLPPGGCCKSPPSKKDEHPDTDEEVAPPSSSEA